MFSKQAANSLVTETSQYFVFFCRSVYSAILAKRLIINVLRLIIVILFFIAFLNITYTARHTWATLAYHSGTPLGLISQSLGHSSIRVTMSYLKPFDAEVIDKVNRQVIALVKGSKKKKVDSVNMLYGTLLR